jgi:hypothetical protein
MFFLGSSMHAARFKRLEQKGGNLHAFKPSNDRSENQPAYISVLHFLARLHIFFLAHALKGPKDEQLTLAPCEQRLQRSRAEKTTNLIIALEICFSASPTAQTTQTETSSFLAFLDNFLLSWHCLGTFSCPCGSFSRLRSSSLLKVKKNA